MGGVHGIGRAYGEGLAREGARVVAAEAICASNCWRLSRTYDSLSQPAMAVLTSKPI
jgi:NAD(P)-dependent dehydrogenase (short-subunit alcohol dehydrogenase family)